MNNVSRVNSYVEWLYLQTHFKVLPGEIWFTWPNLYWLNFLLPWYKPRLSEKREFNWEYASTILVYRQDYRGFSWLMTDMGGPSPLYVMLPLACIRNQAEQLMRNKPVRRIPLWPWLQFLSLGSCSDVPKWGTVSCKAK